MLILLSILFFVSLLLVIHPFITYPLSLELIRRSKKFAGNKLEPADKIENSYNIGLLVCGYNEESVIEEKIKNGLALKLPDSDQEKHKLKIYFYDDCSYDDTAQIVEKLQTQYGDERIILVKGEERAGKTMGMNKLVARARDDGMDLLMFSDANVMIDENSISHALSWFEHKEIGGVSGHLIYTNKDENATSELGSTYWQMEEEIKQLEMDTGSLVGGDGSLFIIRAKLYREKPGWVIDDFHSTMSVVCDGYRMIRDHNIKAYEKFSTNRDEEFRRKIRIATRCYNCYSFMKEQNQLDKLDGLHKYKYYSHRIIRWLSIYFMAIGALSLLFIGIGLGYGAEFILLYLLATILIYLGIEYKIPVISKVSEVLMMFYAVGVGVFKSVNGEKFQTWSSPKTTRS